MVIFPLSACSLLTFSMIPYALKIIHLPHLSWMGGSLPSHYLRNFCTFPEHPVQFPALRISQHKSKPFLGGKEGEMLEKFKILDVCAPWETEQCGIFILDIFHVTGTLLNLDPGLIREASPSFVSFLLASTSLSICPQNSASLKLKGQKRYCAAQQPVSSFDIYKDGQV